MKTHSTSSNRTRDSVEKSWVGIKIILLSRIYEIKVLIKVY